MSSLDRAPVRALWRTRFGASYAAHVDAPPGIDLIVDPDAGLDAMDGTEVLVDGSPPDAFLDAPTLTRVIVPYAGIRSSLRDALRARPRLTLHNSHFNAAFVAQHALALLLACSQRLVRYDRAMRQGDWRSQADTTNLHLAGRTAVLLGYGAIGRAMVPMLHGLGLSVEAVRTRPDPGAVSVPEHASADLASVLPRADVLIVSLPSTPATIGVLDASAYQALPDDAIVINVGRGDVLDEEATWQALDGGRLAGLGLDVWWRYPAGAAERTTTLASHRPFHLHPDVVLSPHRASDVERAEEASVRDVLTTLAAIVGGRDPNRNRVDVTAGF